MQHQQGRPSSPILCSPKPGLYVRAKHSASGTLTRITFKSKITSYYDQVLNASDNVAWDEFFILKPNSDYLELFFSERSNADLMIFAGGVRTMAEMCVQYGSHTTDARKLNCYLTLRIIFSNLAPRRYGNWTTEIAELLCGFEHMDAFFNRLLLGIKEDLTVGSVEIRSAALDMLFTIASANVANINANAFNEYLMLHDLFDLLLRIVTNDAYISIAPKALAILTLLAQYKRTEAPNAYVHKLHSLIDVEIYRAIAANLSKDIRNARNMYILPASMNLDNDDEIPFSMGSMMYSLTSLIWASNNSQVSPTEDSRDFHTLPSNEVAVSLSCFEFIEGAPHFVATLLSLMSVSSLDLSTSSVTSSLIDSSTTSARTFIVDLLSLCSYIFCNSHSTRSHTYVALLMRSLRCLCLHPTFCPFATNEKFPQSVRLCRQKQPRLPKLDVSAPLMPSLLDTIIGHMRHNLRRKISIPTYICALEIVNTCMTFLRKSRLRLTYHWAEVWKTLLSVLAFVLLHVDRLKQINSTVFTLLDWLLVCFNTAVVYGDVFLPDSNGYDSLYYEILRQRETFTELEQCYPEPTHPLVRLSVRNIQAVLSHFTEAIASDTTIRKLTTEQVMTLVKQSYTNLELSADSDTLELKGNMEYAHVDATMVRAVMADYKVRFGI